MAREWSDLVRYLDSVESRYLEELGETAYAAFNAITDIASHAPNNRCIHRDRHSLQRLAGTWVSQFSQQCREPAFDLTSYLDDLAKSPPPASSPLGRGMRAALPTL
jgi:hypothetical protein